MGGGVIEKDLERGRLARRIEGRGDSPDMKEKRCTGSRGIQGG